jgi:hypothetical protein
MHIDLRQRSSIRCPRRRTRRAAEHDAREQRQGGATPGWPEAVSRPASDQLVCVCQLSRHYSAVSLQSALTRSLEQFKAQKSLASKHKLPPQTGGPSATGTCTLLQSRLVLVTVLISC